MKATLLFLFFATAVLSVGCWGGGGDDEPSGEYQWHTFYGTSDDEWGSALAVDRQGNVFISGTCRSPWEGPDGQAPINAFGGTSEDPDLFIIKLDSTGAYQWHTYFPCGDGGTAHALAADADGDIYLAGNSFGTWNGPSGEAPLSAHSGDNDILILKLNSAGQYQWHAFFGSSSFDDAASIVLDEHQNILIAGESRFSWNGPDGQEPVNPHAADENYDLVVIKLDSAGAYQWHTFFGAGQTDQVSDDFSDFAYSIAANSMADILVAGISDSKWIGPDGQSPLHAHSGSYDTFVLKLDSSGAYRWHTFWGNAGGSMAIDGSDNIIIAGGATGPWTGPDGQPPLNAFSGSGPYQSEIVVLKLDINGNYQWHTFHGGSTDFGYDFDEDGALSVTVGEHGNIFATGRSYAAWSGPNGEAPLNAFSGDAYYSSDIFVLKLSSSGRYRWHSFFGGFYDDGGSSIVADDSGNIFVTGESSSWSGPENQAPLNAYAAGLDIFVLKMTG